MSILPGLKTAKIAELPKRNYACESLVSALKSMLGASVIMMNFDLLTHHL